MYCKIIEEVCREPLGEVQFEKNGGKTKWKGGKVFIEPLGGVEIFPRVCGEPHKSIRYWRGLFQDH
jgi:hypothetical protein